MRVVFLRSNSVNPDPRVEKEVKSLLKAGYTVKVIAWNRNEPKLKKNDKILTEKGYGIIERKFILGSFNKGILNIFPFLKWQLFLIYWLIKHRKFYDVIHSCDFDTAIPTLIIKLLFKKIFVYDIFDYYIHSFKIPKIFLPFIYIFDRLVLKIADAIIIPDENRVKQINIPHRKIFEVIYNTPEDYYEDFKNISNNNYKDKFRIVYVGILTRHRFLLEMIDIVAKHSDWELYIGGFGELEEEIYLISKEYMNIKFLGKIPYNEALKIMSESDILFAIYDPLIPNHKYSSPNKVFEAMMLGKPVLVANKTGIDKLVRKEKIGFCIDYNDKKGLERILETLKKNQILRMNLGMNARKLYIEKYSWRLMEKRLINLYDYLKGTWYGHRYHS